MPRSSLRPVRALRTIRTAEQLLRLHDPPWRHQLVRGELQTMSPPGYWHGDVCQAIAVLLGQHVRATKCGKLYANDTGFLVARGPDTVLAPDFGFVRAQRVPKTRRAGYFEGPPDLAIEVRSPNDSRRDLRAKAKTWIAHGAHAVWIVDPLRETVRIASHGVADVELSGEDVLADITLLPGFAVPVRTIFAD